MRFRFCDSAVYGGSMGIRASRSAYARTTIRGSADKSAIGFSLQASASASCQEKARPRMARPGFLRAEALWPSRGVSESRTPTRAGIPLARESTQGRYFPFDYSHGAAVAGPPSRVGGGWDPASCRPASCLVPTQGVLRLHGVGGVGNARRGAIGL